MTSIGYGQVMKGQVKCGYSLIQKGQINQDGRFGNRSRQERSGNLWLRKNTQKELGREKWRTYEAKTI